MSGVTDEELTPLIVEGEEILQCPCGCTLFRIRRDGRAICNDCDQYTHRPDEFAQPRLKS